jgi:hypothetical protein
MQAILRRLYREAELPDSGESKHTLALAAGFNPPNATSRAHLNEFDSHVRVTHIFDGDDETYKQLKFASDHFEHGSRGFDRVQDAAEVAADKAFGYVRRAILREIGVAGTSGLLTEKYDEPQAGWQPVFQVTGRYTSTRSDDWPFFYGLSSFPEISDIVDLDDDQKRTVTYKVTENGAALLAGQTVTPESTIWVNPFTADRQIERGDPEVEFVPADTASADEQSPPPANGRQGVVARFRRWLASLIEPS